MTDQEYKFLIELRYASDHSFEAKIKTLLDSGMSINTCDDNGVSALCHAIHSPIPNWKYLKFLLTYGPDLDHADVNCLQMTPLMHAILEGNPSVVIQLLNAGANSSIKDALGLTAYDYIMLLLKDDDPLSIYTKHYSLLILNTSIQGTIYDHLKSSDKKFPYSQYFKDFSADGVDSCVICKHFREHPNGELYMETGVPGVFAYNRIVYQLFELISNDIQDGTLWRTYQQDVYVKCPICKSRYHYHRWWDDEWGCSTYLECFKRL